MVASVEFLARVDSAEIAGAYIERMARVHGDAAVTAWDMDTIIALRGEAFDPEPDPPAPVPANVIPFRPRPFDRAEHCRRAGRAGGAATVAKHGAGHMRAIGAAGAKVTIERHGYAAWLGHVKAKGWTGPRRPDLAADLAAGRYLADLAA